MNRHLCVVIDRNTRKELYSEVVELSEYQDWYNARHIVADMFKKTETYKTLGHDNWCVDSVEI